MKRQSMIDELGEAPEITQQRDTAKKTLEVLRKAQMTIRRDPDFEGKVANEEVKWSSITIDRYMKYSER